MIAEPVPALALWCLGTPTARVAGSEPPPEVLWRKHLALLTYLSLSPGYTRTRSHLMGLLWAESPESNARRSLNEAVRVLRTALGSERLITDGEALQLNVEGLSVDVLEFETLCSEGQLRALELVRGELLEGFYVEDSPGFDAWMEARRAQIRDAATHLLNGRAEEQLAVNRHIEARALARRALVISPHSEPAVSLAMRSAALEGDAAGALALYHDFAMRLEADIGESPSPDLAALAGRIREGTWQRHRDRYADQEPPLVGRRDQHARLFAALDRLPREGPALVLISGDTGSGRTRLLDACIERTALAGATVAVARILETDHDAPWSTLRALMRGGLLDAPGLAATDPLGLRVLASLVPELAARVPPLEARDVAQVSDAFASLLRSAAEEHPVVLLIDDAQWADGPTLTVLRAVWSRQRAAPLTLVLTVQSGLELSPPLHTLAASVGGDVAGVQVRLEPFSTDEIAALTEAMAPWCTEKIERARLARRVEHESGGNAFLAVTLLRDLTETATRRQDLLDWPRPGATYDTTLPITIPGVVRNAIVARTARLNPESIAVLRAASVAGEIPDAALLAEVSGLPIQRVEAAFDQLERERFVVFDGRRYAFNGQLVSAVVERECTQPGGRRRLRQRYIAALAPRDDLESQLLRVRLLAVEQDPEAFDAARVLTERALALGAVRTGTAALRAAERAAASDPDQLGVLKELRDRLGRAPAAAT